MMLALFSAEVSVCIPCAVIFVTSDVGQRSEPPYDSLSGQYWHEPGLSLNRSAVTSDRAAIWLEKVILGITVVCTLYYGLLAGPKPARQAQK
jgi:hypothetical protein